MCRCFLTFLCLHPCVHLLYEELAHLLRLHIPQNRFAQRLGPNCLQVENSPHKESRFLGAILSLQAVPCLSCPFLFVLVRASHLLYEELAHLLRLHILWKGLAQRLGQAVHDGDAGPGRAEVDLHRRLVLAVCMVLHPAQGDRAFKEVKVAEAGFSAGWLKSIKSISTAGWSWPFAWYCTLHRVTGHSNKGEEVGEGG